MTNYEATIITTTAYVWLSCYRLLAHRYYAPSVLEINQERQKERQTLSATLEFLVSTGVFAIPLAIGYDFFKK